MGAHTRELIAHIFVIFEIPKVPHDALGQLFGQLAFGYWGPVGSGGELAMRLSATSGSFASDLPKYLH